LKFCELRPHINTIPRSDKKQLPVDEIASLYRSGMTKADLAIRFGVGEMTISNRLTIACIPTAANRADAMRTRLARMTIDERLDITKAAHDAVRGSKRSVKDLTKRAIGVERAGAVTSVYETMFRDFLTSIGKPFIAQKAIGIYNADFAVGPIAVETFGGCFHGFGKHAERIPQRMRDILDEGWNIYIIWCLDHDKILTPAVLDDFITFDNLSSINPTFRGQYRVIWSDGQVIASGDGNSDNFSDVIPNTMRHYASSKD